MNQYLKSFIIGSSFPVVIPFLFTVSQFKPSFFHFDYKIYSLIAPLFLGLMNVFYLAVQQVFGLSLTMRFGLMAMIAPTTVLITVYLLNIYTYTKEQWTSHIIKTYLLYATLSLIVIPYLESVPFH